MNPMQMQINYKELTPAQYVEKHGLGEAAVRSRCKQGILNAYRTDGGHWKIRDYLNEVVDRAAFEALLSENIELKAKIETIKKALS